VATTTAADTGPPLTETSATSADTGVQPTLHADCQLDDDNGLRAWCDITVDPPQPVEVTFASVDGGPSRVHTSEASVGEHRVGLFIMRPETDYAWSARTMGSEASSTGTFTTGELPVEAQLIQSSQGLATHQRFLHASPCQDRGMVVVTDVDDGVVWYHAFPPDKVVALQHTRDDTIITLVGSDILEIDWMGQPVRTMSTQRLLHHDVYRADGGLTYALFKETQKGVPPFIVDGFVVLDSGGAELGVWRLADHYPPQARHPVHGLDVHHANSIHVENGVALVSVRHTSMIVAVAADPALPDFGTVLWSLHGKPNATRAPTEYALTASAGGSATFKEQHHAVMQPDGRLTLFDNRVAADQNSRGLVIRLDAGVADIEEVYELTRHCNYQGGMALGAAGNPVLNCADRGLAYEFDTKTAEITWQQDTACATGTSGMIPRFVPVDP